ncbi:MAG TPA: protein translocase subunit SecF [Syntrophales bacterium]|nr:protein translocase subunit SecF [Syntrophales bacterium]HPI56485.1 protein translocase subunit SecF [Syntrophales bacterium]HPN25094.1 protein translocase subunit SecF [Syntrophales bacterium]HQM29163.1 protein translocase subunit SecF [Syntrophales bacterium]
MLEFIRSDTKLDFVSKMKMAVIGSLVLILFGAASIIYHGGLNLGVDFAGGALIQLKFQKESSVDRIRSALEGAKIENCFIQQFGARDSNEYLVRTAEAGIDLKAFSDRIESALTSIFGQGSYEVRRIETVGPKIGKDLAQKAIWALTLSWIAMLVYVGFRFEFRYAVGGIIALVHDVLVTVGVLSLLNMEFTLNTVAALLTIIGFSINDTIVIFDRIRENRRKNVKIALRDLVNISVNQTLSRTILTSFTVFLVLVVLLVLGGPVIFDFAFTMFVGVVAGVYSTVFIASPIVLALEGVKPARKRKK